MLFELPPSQNPGFRKQGCPFFVLSISFTPRPLRPSCLLIPTPSSLLAYLDHFSPGEFLFSCLIVVFFFFFGIIPPPPATSLLVPWRILVLKQGRNWSSPFCIALLGVCSFFAAGLFQLVNCWFHFFLATPPSPLLALVGPTQLGSSILRDHFYSVSSASFLFLSYVGPLGSFFDFSCLSGLCSSPFAFRPLWPITTIFPLLTFYQAVPALQLPQVCFYVSDPLLSPEATLVLWPGLLIFRLDFVFYT